MGDKNKITTARVLRDTVFGDVTMQYKMVDIDGTNLEEAVEVYLEDGDVIGVIFSIDIEHITKDLIETECYYGYNSK